MSAALLTERLALFHGRETSSLCRLEAAMGGERRGRAHGRRSGGEEKSCDGGEKDFLNHQVTPFSYYATLRRCNRHHGTAGRQPPCFASCSIGYERFRTDTP